MVEQQLGGQPQQTRALPVIIVIFLLGLIMLLVFGFAAPVNSVILVNLMQGIDEILILGQPNIDNIGDAGVRNSVNNAISSGIVAGTNTIEVNAFLYQFGWLLFILIMFTVIFLISNNRSSSSSRSGLI